MERVIKISEDVFTRLFDNGTETSPDDRRAIETAIRNGKPLDTVLGEIRAEINELYSYVEFDENIKTSFNMVRLEEVQKVIDKYRAESEGKECRN